MKILPPYPTDSAETPLEFGLSVTNPLDHFWIDPDSDEGANHGYRREVLK